MTRARWTSGEASDRDEFNLTRVFFFAALHLGVVAVFWQTNWMAIGMAIYFLYGRSHSLLGQRESVISAR